MDERSQKAADRVSRARAVVGWLGGSGGGSSGGSAGSSAGIAGNCW